MTNSWSLARLASPAAAIALLSGCVSLLPEPPPAARVFPLRAEAAPVTGAASMAVLSVAEPSVPQSMATADIVWIRDGAVGYMDQSVWTSRTPILLQALLIETIDAQDRARAAIQAGSGARADLEVRWDVRDFQVEEGGGRLEAVFSADVKVLEVGSRRVRAAKAVTLRQPLEERTAAAAADALRRVAQASAREIAAFAAAEAEQVLPHQEPGASLIPQG